MFTDIVGYTTLGQENESAALELLERHRQLLRPLFSKHAGHEIKTMGDAFLVEFASALEATLCAIDIQSTVHSRNLERGEKLQVRIGIHVGDVVHQGNDLLGDAVNVASRIVPLAEAGGICISEHVFYQVKNKVSYPFNRLETRQLKNVKDAIEVYRIVFPWEGLEIKGIEFDTRRIAVLPFANMSPDPSDEYFADGITEELISTISKIRGLTVISRTSVMKFKNASASVDEIGRSLKVSSVIEGSVRKLGNRARITAQLIDVSTDGHLWSQSYDRDLNDVFAIQSNIAQEVTEALKVTLLSNEKKDIERWPTENTEAYSLYLKGRFFWNERTRDGLNKAARHLEGAVKLDPNFALAYAGLADCLVVQPNYGWLAPHEAYPKAKEYALRAIEMDPRLAEPHAALGTIYASYEHKWVQADDEFKRALELKPSYATAYHWRSILLRFMGRYSESYEDIERASVLDPLSRVIGNNLGKGLALLGRLDEAIQKLERVIEANPDWAHVHAILGWVYFMASRNGEAIDESRKAVAMSGGEPSYKADLAYWLGVVGRRGEANKIIEELEELAKTTYVDKVDIASALFGAGRTDEAFNYLEKGYEEKSDEILYFREAPWFKGVQKDPRWAVFESRLGLPEV